MPGGTVLITGGTGAIGGHLARWLTRSGAPRVVLAGRSGPAAPGAGALAAELAGAGTAASVVACDTADRTAVAGLLAWIGAGGPRLAAVLHAAGVLDDGMLDGMSTARLATVLAAKATGAAHLDELTAGLDLDAFVLFSSVAATLGGPGQGNYAAANAFLDALARRRAARGLAALSVAWGPWAGGGMSGVSDVVRERMRRGPLPPMDPDLAIKALSQALSGGDRGLAVMDVDWSQFAAAPGADQVPFLRDMPEIRQLAANPGAGAGAAVRVEGELAQRLAGAPEGEQARILTELVRAVAADVLGHASPDAIEADRAFSDHGFDSLTAVELRNRLAAATGLRLPTTLLFDYPAPAVAAEFLRSELLGAPAGNPGPAPAAVAGAAGEPVAIVAMGCRFPGGARNPEQLWELLAAGVDTVSEFPLDRGWDLEALFDPDPERAGTSHVRRGGFMYDAAEFDPGFFGISPREALAMDPQQRLLLEVSWEAFERAGIAPASLRGSTTGVFVGATLSGYGVGMELGSHLVTGTATSVMSGRVSYVLGLEGPAVTVDTACSSSLVALHLACQALRAGECTLALAGGAAVLATPGLFVAQQQQGLAADGRCKSFSAAADGMGIAEGVGVVLLERLADARRHGHQVLAMVRGSAVNQDGASNGLTAPNGPSQQRVIQAALASAQVSAAEVDVVEAHGSGTVLGDPIEAQAVLATYGQGRPQDQPLWLGSVKSNIGHAQEAAGAAGMIKMVLALQHEMLPQTLHAGEPTPHVDWSAGSVRLLTEPVPWPAGGRPRRAGVSAFGMSGTNVHVILEEPFAGDRVPEPASEGPAEPRRLPVVSPEITTWVVSGRTPEGLVAQAGRLTAHLTARPDLDPNDVGCSLAATRSAFEYRAVVIGEERGELAAGMAGLAAGDPPAGVAVGAVGDPGKVVFVFPGQGAQYAGMGREFAAASPVFAARLAECGRALAPYVDWSLEDVIAGADGAPGLAAAEVVQPVLWAVMVSLAAVWEAAGITPDAVIGHSQGEIAAACVAGMLSLEDAAKVVAVRSRVLSGLGVLGGMVSVVMPAAGVAELLGRWEEQLSIAAVNGPAATVVSGDLAALAEFEAELSARRVMRWRIPETDFVAHSPRVAGVAGVLAAELAGIQPARGRVRLFSTVECRWMDGPELDAGYWFANVRQRVRFDEAVRALAGAGHRTFIEVSPHPVLELAIADTIEETGIEGVPLISGTLHRESSGARNFLTVLARLHVQGVTADWAAVLGAGRRVELPTYAFQRQRYWPQPSDELAATVVPVGGDGAGTVAEARFWAAVEGGDMQALSQALAVDGQQPLSEVLPALASWRRRERDRSVTGAWRYRVMWVPVPDPEPAVLSGIWLVVAPAGPEGADLAEGCVRALAARGARVVTVGADAGEADRDMLAARIGQALAGPQEAPQDAPPGGVCGVLGVVSLLALAEVPVPGFAVVAAGLAGTLALVQALGDARVDAPLWVLTRGAVAAGAGEVLASPVQAQVWGLGRAAALEHPDRWGGLIDLPPVLDGRAAARLCAVLAGSGEDQVAIRPAGVMGRRLARAPQPRAGAEAWVPRGTALITGGTGAIGGHVARWLAQRGAPRLVLAGRSGPAAPGAAALAAGLAALGAETEVIACDVAERAEVAALLARIGASGAPLTAVLHAAGVLDDGVLDRLDTERLASVLAGKAAAAVHLDELTADLDLDAFALFSSAAAVLGSAGQGNYGAANAFLDALAQQRSARGLPAVSVAWGPWAGGGVAQASTVVQQRLRRGPLPEMDPGLAVKALGQALDGADSVLAVMDVNWTQFVGADQVPFFRDLPEVRQLTRDPGDWHRYGAGPG